jgi:hypothetical protein
MASEHVLNIDLKAAPGSHGPSEDEITLRRHQAESQLGSLRAIFVSNIVTAMMVTLALYDELPLQVRLPWLVVFFAVFHPARRSWMANFAGIPSGWRPGGWEYRMALTGAVSGFAWAVPILAAGTHIVPMREVLQNALVIGLVAVTYAVNPVNRSIFLGYSLALVGPLAIRNVLSGDAVLSVIAVLTLPFIGLLSAHQGVAVRRLMRAIAHERENQRLTSELEDANGRLQSQVQELAAAKAEADPVPPDLLLRADPRAVRQILLNLISNAVKFTDAGGSVRVAACADPSGLRLTVADTGVGIAAEDLDRVVEPFRQVAGPLSRSRGGTGLGLSIVKSLGDLHGAKLDLSSRLGKGTVVSVVFPPDRVTHAAAANGSIMAEAGGA